MKRVPLLLAIVAIAVSGFLYLQLQSPPRAYAEEAGRKLAEMQNKPSEADRLRVEAAAQIDLMLDWKRTRLQLMFPLLGVGLALLALHAGLARAARAGLGKRALLAVALVALAAAPVLFGLSLQTPAGWAVAAAKGINDVRAAEGNGEYENVRTLRSAQDERDRERRNAQEDQQIFAALAAVAGVVLYGVFFFVTRPRTAAPAPAPAPAAAG